MLPQAFFLHFPFTEQCLRSRLTPLFLISSQLYFWYILLRVFLWPKDGHLSLPISWWFSTFCCCSFPLTRHPPWPQSSWNSTIRLDRLMQLSYREAAVVLLLFVSKNMPGFLFCCINCSNDRFLWMDMTISSTYESMKVMQSRTSGKQAHLFL